MVISVLLPGIPVKIAMFINSNQFPVSMKIHLSNSAFLGNIDTFLRSFNRKKPEELEITAHKKWISIHPVVLSMVAAIGLTVKPENIHCERLEAKSKHYLERMGLFRLLNIDSSICMTEHESSGRFIPLTRIENSDDMARFITDMIPLLHLEPDQAEPIKHIVAELVRNVLEHSGSEEGAIVCAQYYKKTNRISLGIVDIGVGIKKTISMSHDAPTDSDALRLALMPGITGTTRRGGGTEFNAGAGLFLIKSIAYVNRDFFMLYSGKAMYKLLKSKEDTGKIMLNADPLRDKHSGGDDFPRWQGTVVGIDMSLDNRRDFSILLDYIWETYSKAIKERRSARYREARFI